MSQTPSNVSPGGESSSHPSSSGVPDRTSGPGRVLIAVYAIFAVAATSRAGVQLSTQFHEAPLAYLLSAFAAVVYIVATVSLARKGIGGWKVARAACLTELVGVLVIGTASLVFAADFPKATVWSWYGAGYGFVPLVLPVLGLLWLKRTRPGR